MFIALVILFSGNLMVRSWTHSFLDLLGDGLNGAYSYGSAGYYYAQDGYNYYIVGEASVTEGGEA